MKGAKLEIARAARIRAAVFLACAGKALTAPGRRIEEIAGVPLKRYPDEVIPLELLPTIADFRFIGWTADFEEIECSQQDCGKTLVWSAPVPLVGWKPIRQGVLLESIAEQTITTKKGLLYRGKEQLHLPEADLVAMAHGYRCAEHMVRELKKKKKHG